MQRAPCSPGVPAGCLLTWDAFDPFSPTGTLTRIAQMATTGPDPQLEKDPTFTN